MVDRTLAERFKRAVVERRGRLDLSREGEEALRLYLRERQAKAPPTEKDPLLKAIGMLRSTGGRVNAMEDERRLYDEA